MSHTTNNPSEHDKWADVPSVDGGGGGDNAGPGPVLVNLAGVAPEVVRWIWPNRIALGKLTVIAGDPGLGKSFMSLDISARITTGESWPDDPGTSRDPGAVILIGAEDGLADTVVPRLIAAGANMNKIEALKGFQRKKGKPFDLFTLADVPGLREAILSVPGCKLVVIDPVGAFYGNIDSHKNDHVRALLAPLAALAEETGVAILVVAHLNKGGTGAKSVYRVSGSLGLIAAARSAWVVAKAQDDPERRLLLPMKNNIAPDVGGLGFRIDGEPARVVWEPDAVNISADDALATDAGNGEDRSALQDAKAFLTDALAGGPISAKAARKAAHDAGIADRTLDRAKDALKVRAKKIGYDGAWMWTLPEVRQDASKNANISGPGDVAHLTDFGALGPIDGPDVPEWAKPKAM